MVKPGGGLNVWSDNRESQSGIESLRGRSSITPNKRGTIAKTCLDSNRNQIEPNPLPLKIRTRCGSPKLISLVVARTFLSKWSERCHGNQFWSDIGTEMYRLLV